MANVFDAAAYILKKNGPMSTMKLQKLCYYAQAWSLVWDDRILAYYGGHDAQWLSQLTHMEAPWRQAREGIPGGEESSRVISKESMGLYYGGL